MALPAVAAEHDQIIHLNVGGQLFSTSKTTLTWIRDTFFTSLLSGRIATVEDGRGAKFIDRDPELFRHILNYLRTKQIDLNGVSLPLLRHEAQFYGITPLVKRLTLCEEMNESACGDVLYHGMLQPPEIPIIEGFGVSLPLLRHEAQFYGITPLVKRLTLCEEMNESACGDVLYHGMLQPPEIPIIEEKPAKRVPSNRNNSMSSESSSSSSLTNRLLPAKFQNLSLKQDTYSNSSTTNNVNSSSSTTSSTSGFRGHAKKSSYELTKQVKNDLSNMIAENDLCSSQPLRVRIIRAHNNSVAVAYCNFVACYKMKENVDWQQFFTTPKMSSPVSHISLISKFVNQPEKLAVALGDNSIHLWCFEEPQDDTRDLSVQKLGIFHLDAQIDKLFFIGNQLVALSRSGKVGIWHSMTQNWQRQ
uniref:BTB domain-containing protein n=1 Tax=Panagrolaimus sp. ES5 TaxID=591445 RepID=A0AC34FZ09_9BILA